MIIKKIITAMAFLFLLLSGRPLLAQEEITPATALNHYLSNNDSSYSWTIKNSYPVGSVRAYDFLLISQQWREHKWTHQLTVLVPAEVKSDGALLFITGGSTSSEGMPNWTSNADGLTTSLSAIAEGNHAVVAFLKQTPNQPLYNGLTEDALISYTLHNFKKDGDYSWPLLFPMVKSAIRAMDAVQEFSKKELKRDINRFVVSGASKRGWTTWLTGASDKRVAAIAPMVIDMLNIPVSMNYQIKVWKDYSVQIEDYVKLGLVQDMGKGAINDLATMIDPYAYRKVLTMPKMLVMGTNDEYWPIDNVKNYYDSIPGQNLLHYVPNVGHSLGNGAEAMTTLSAFFGFTLKKQPYPLCSWKVVEGKKGIEVNVQATADKLVDVIVWHADSPDQDFRNDKWESRSLGISHKSKISVLQPYPASGYSAFYVDLKYLDANGKEYTESTRVFMTDNGKLM